MKGVGSIYLGIHSFFLWGDFSMIERSLLFNGFVMFISPPFLYFFAFWSDRSSEILITIKFTSHKKEEWAETAKGIDNEMNSEKNKENVRALLSLIIDYKY